MHSARRRSQSVKRNGGLSGGLSAVGWCELTNVCRLLEHLCPVRIPLSHLFAKLSNEDMTNFIVWLHHYHFCAQLLVF
jgi:hypothetical protein